MGAREGKCVFLFLRILIELVSTIGSNRLIEEELKVLKVIKKLKDRVSRFKQI